jgi:hypothetical protein
MDLNTFLTSNKSFTDCGDIFRLNNRLCPSALWLQY